MLYNRKTKIVATIGPKVANKTKLEEMYKTGMSVARLNGSHNNLDWHAKVINLIKKTLPDCPILLDIPGKKIRTTKLLADKRFKKNDTLILTTLNGFNGEQKISITSRDLHLYLSKGDIVFADDGTLKFKVLRISKKDIYLKAFSSGVLKSSKGINVPHVRFKGKLVTSIDISMINFAIKNKVDFIGISFVESAKHINDIKKLVKNNIPQIVAKIENQIGLDNLEEITDSADAIMIDRGDLSTETNIQTLAVNQKKIIKKAIELSKPVILATEMLDNMISKPYPTKAEVLDISNSVLDGASAVMLSGETAVGDYPIEAIKVMSEISTVIVRDKYENYSDSQKLSKYTENIGMSGAINSLCRSLPISKIVAITISGYAARIVSSLMLQQPIIAVSNNKDLARSFNILNGTKGVYYNTKFFRNSLEHIPKCLNHLRKLKILKKDDLILVTALGYPGSGRRMNIIQTHLVKDLIKNFHWI